MFAKISSLFTGRVSSRIGSSFVLLGILMLGCAGAGYYGLSRYGASLAFISGPAWETADGSMEGVIEIEAQMLAVRQLLAGEDEKTNLDALNEHGEAAKGAFAQVANAKLTSSERLDELNRLITEYNNSLNALVEAYRSAKSLNEIQATQQQKLNGLQNTIREFLTALPAKAKLANEFDAGVSQPNNANAELPAVLFELSTILGDIRATSQEFRVGGSTELQSNLGRNFDRALVVADSLVQVSNQCRQSDPDFARLSEKATSLKEFLGSYIAATKQMVNSQLQKGAQLTEYSTKTEALLDFIDIMESEGDAVVDNAAAEVAPLKRKMSLLIGSIALTSLVLSIIAAIFCTRAITRPIHQLVEVLKEFGEGNLTKKLNMNRKDELGDMAIAFNAAAGKINAMVKKLGESSVSLAYSAEQVSTTAVVLANGVHRTTDQTALVNSVAGSLSDNMTTVSSTSNSMSENIDSVSNSIHEMTSTISEIAQVTQRYASDVAATRDLASTTNQRMQGLLKAANSINNVVELIDDLAEQTNLLALNATIEAARAGEAGKGFAVVATEVKDLAKQTAMATADIRSSIQSVQQATQEAVQSIEAINSMISGMNQTTDRIAAAIEEQSVTTRSMSEHMTSTTQSVSRVAQSVQESTTASHQITASIAEVDRVAHESAASATQFVDAGEQMQRLAAEINDLIRQFEVA